MIIFILFIISIVLFWINWFVIQYAWSNVNDILFSITNISLLLLLLLIIVVGALAIFSRFRKSMVSNKHSVITSVLGAVIFVFVILIHSVPVYILSSAGEKITSVTNIVSKETGNDNEYFLYIEDIFSNDIKKIKCDKNKYSKVILDENVLYTMEYRMHLFDSKSGFLVQLDLEDYIDNRNIILR